MGCLAVALQLARGGALGSTSIRFLHHLSTCRTNRRSEIDSSLSSYGEEPLKEKRKRTQSGHCQESGFGRKKPWNYDIEFRWKQDIQS